jgi:hypothetical protein
VQWAQELSPCFSYAKPVPRSFSSWRQDEFGNFIDHDSQARRSFDTETPCECRPLSNVIKVAVKGIVNCRALFDESYESGLIGNTSDC